MRQATGCRSAFGDQWPQITSARRFPALDRFTNRASRADDPTRTYCCRIQPLALAGVASVQSHIKQYGQEELQ
jgi:hypothetical protein